MVFYHQKCLKFLCCDREEKVYDREEVFGRDAASVFPTEAKAAALDPEAVKQLIGGKKFISESEVRLSAPLPAAQSALNLTWL